VNTFLIQPEELLANRGIKTTSIKKIPEGSNHHVYTIADSIGKEMILKIMTSDTPRRDPLFNGEMSLQRELGVYEVLRRCKALRIPKIYDTDNKTFVLMEKLSGTLWSDYIRANNFSKTAFLDSITSLGKVFAELHKVQLPAFGNLVSIDTISNASDNYADRFLNILDYRLLLNLKNGAMTEAEITKIREYCTAKSTLFREYLDIKKVQLYR